MKTIIFILIALFTVSSYSAQSLANRIKGANLCTPIYKGVKNVIIDYEAQGPQKEDFTIAVKHEISAAKEVLSYAGIIPQLAEHNKTDVSKLSENTLLVKVLYSYVDKKSFSIPLENNQIASWVEVYRNQVDENGEKKLISVKTNINFFGADEQNATSLSVASNNLIEEVACNVIQYTANKKCTDRINFTRNKIIDTEACFDSSSHKSSLN